jgi:DNA polymerase III delta prime subunit
MFRKHIILFNGPPGSGKDAVALEFIKYCVSAQGVPKNINICKFADSIRNTVFATFKHVTTENYDEVKDEIIPGFNNCITLRQWIIRYAETFMKPVLGNNVFGALACKDIEKKLYDDDIDYILVTDLGFQEELEEVLNIFRHRDMDILLVRLHRNETTFKRDSRQYLSNKEIDIIDKISLTRKCTFNVIDIDNNSTLKKCVQKIVGELHENADITFYNEKIRK